MAEDNSGSFQFPWPTFIAAIGALGGLVWYLGPLNSDRPTGSIGKIAFKPPNYQDVDSRLWQDPLDSAMAAAQEDAKGDPLDWLGPIASSLGLKKPTEHRPELELERSPGSQTLLAVMLEPGNYADSVERRRRERYAVVNGLNQADYAPIDSMHIGYLERDDWQAIEPAPKPGAPALSPRTLIVPFEWFKKEGHPDDRVLVLWLDEGEFADAPLPRLQELFEWITKTLTFSQIKLIGPRGSSTLKQMIDGAPPGTNLNVDLWKNVEVFSPSATVPQGIMDLAGKSTDATGSGPQPFPLRLHRTVADDYDVCAAMSDELKKRRVKVRSENTAIIGEWDTLYGRSLLVSFMAAVRGGRGKLEDAYHECTGEKAPSPSEFTPFLCSYLRGVDGRTSRLPDQKKDSKTGSGGDTEPKSSNPLNFLEPTSEAPEGDYQFDYLRRLSGDLERFDRQDRLEHGYAGGGLQVIGILGSDVYDKLIILQALRPRFPDAIFFTTDLDARLGNHAEWKWAHNLVVASSYGLELCGQFQQDSPPFRDSNQTATYLATMAAMGVDGLPGVDELNRQPVTLFEIGRSGPYYFGAAPIPGVEIPKSVQPGADDPLAWWHGVHKIGAILCVILAVIVARIVRAFPAGGNLREILMLEQVGVIWRSDRLKVRPWARVTVTAVATIGIVLLLIAIGTQTPLTGLPLAWFEGISIWPSELIRAAASILGAYLMFRGWRKLEASNDDLDKTYQGKLGTTLEATWQDYKLRSSSSSRWRRVAVMLVAYILFTFVLFFTFGLPKTPTRGFISFVAAIVTLIIVTLVFGLLTFFVVDATGTAKHCIRKAATDELHAMVPHHLLNELNFVASLTKPVTNLIYYPFFMLTLMIVSRLSIFADWTWPWSIILIFVINSFWAIYAAHVLRRCAEETRQRAIDQLHEQAASIPGKAEVLDRTIAQIKELGDGAFASFLNNPVISAVLLPFAAALFTVLPGISKGG